MLAFFGMPHFVPRWIAGLITLTYASTLACEGETPVVAVTGSGSATSTGPGTSTSSTGASTTSLTEGTSTGATSSDSDTTEGAPECSFLQCDDMGPEGPPSCDAWAQDCPEGHKCTIWANDGGSSWNDTRCVMIHPQPKAPGEVCVAISGVSGVDDCELGAVCWDVYYETHEGTCVSFCGGSEEEPICELGSVCVSLARGGANAGLCLPSCDPIDNDCPGDDLCVPNGEGWLCVLDGSGDNGAYADPCEYANACDPGLYCMSPEHVPGCKAAGCCSPWCNIEAANTCPGATQVCIPWYDDAPPGYEHVGICGTQP